MTFIFFFSAVIGCDELAVATDRQRHEDQEYSSPPAHCKCNDPGIFVFLYLCLFLFLIQARPKHFLVETEDKNVADNAVEPPVDIGTESGEPVRGRWWPDFPHSDIKPVYTYPGLD